MCEREGRACLCGHVRLWDARSHMWACEGTIEGGAGKRRGGAGERGEGGREALCWGSGIKGFVSLSPHAVLSPSQTTPHLQHHSSRLI